MGLSCIPVFYSSVFLSFTLQSPLLEWDRRLRSLARRNGRRLFLYCSYCRCSRLVVSATAVVRSLLSYFSDVAIGLSVVLLLFLLFVAAFGRRRRSLLSAFGRLVGRSSLFFLVNPCWSSKAVNTCNASSKLVGYFPSSRE